MVPFTMAGKAQQQKAERLHLNHTTESETVSGKGDKAIHILKAHPRDILPSAKLHILQVPQPIQTAPPPGDHVFTFGSPWRTHFI